jgi:RNA polymerase sigma-70 factor (ECF subfamily)
MASGDREAFAAIFRRHQGVVYRFSRQMLASREAAEDVTQDVFVALAKSGRRFDPSVSSFSTYLYGIARNLVLQRYKRGRARAEVSIDTVSSADAAALTAADDPVDDTLSRSQLLKQLRLAILRLPVHYREIVVLCELNGLSYEDAAQVAGCPIGTVRSRLNRARRLLVERCKAQWRPAEAGQERQLSGTEGMKRWLILTKNNC